MLMYVFDKMFVKKLHFFKLLKYYNFECNITNSLTFKEIVDIFKN